MQKDYQECFYEGCREEAVGSVQSQDKELVVCNDHAAQGCRGFFETKRPFIVKSRKGKTLTIRDVEIGSED